MIIELNIIIDIYGKPDKKTGKPILVKKGVVLTKIFDSEKLYPETVVNKQGRIIKSRTNITYEGSDYTLAHSMEEIKKLISPIKILGLAGKAKYARAKS